MQKRVVLTNNKQLHFDNIKLYLTINIYNSGCAVVFTIVIYTDVLELTIRSYTSAETAKKFVVGMASNVA